MAGSIACALGRIKQELGQWVDEALMERVCRQAGHRWRRRVLDPLSSVQLLLLQLLAQVGLTGLRHATQAAGRVSAQAICQARQALPLSVWLKLLEHSCVAACSAAGVAAGVGEAPGLWHGLRVFLADGMSMLAPDTPPLRRRYGKGSNQHGPSCSYPLPKLLALMDLGSGLIRKVIALPHARTERTCLSRLLDHLSAGDLLLGDRGLGSYAHVALMAERAVACCIALPRWLSVIGAGKGCHRRLKKLGGGEGLVDLLVRWTRPDQRPKWMRRRAWEALPQELVLRQVNVRVRRPGFRDQWLRVVTTLTDPAAYPAAEVAALYQRRWQVEVYFRDLKRTLGMHRLRSRTVAGVRKELVAFVLLYNLVRQVVCRAAATQGVEPQRVSFTDAARWLLWSDPAEPLPRLLVNPRRRRPPEPRALKHGRRKYPLMNSTRQDLRDRLHRAGRLQKQS
jgi:hypothetical protein